MKTWRRRAVTEPRAVLSVAFPASAFDAVNRAAEATDVYTSAFVRDAALERAARVLGPRGVPPPTAAFGGDYDRTRVSGHVGGT